MSAMQLVNGMSAISLVNLFASSEKIFPGKNEKLFSRVATVLATCRYLNLIGAQIGQAPISKAVCLIPAALYLLNSREAPEWVEDMAADAEQQIALVCKLAAFAASIMAIYFGSALFGAGSLALLALDTLVQAEILPDLVNHCLEETVPLLAVFAPLALEESPILKIIARAIMGAIVLNECVFIAFDAEFHRGRKELVEWKKNSRLSLHLDRWNPQGVARSPFERLAPVDDQTLHFP